MRQKPEEIVTKQRQVMVLVGQWKVKVGAIGGVRISERTEYRWCEQCGEIPRAEYLG